MQFSIPKVGSVVRVTTRHPQTYIFAKEKWKLNQYEGAVIAPEKWMKPGEFSVVTGNPKFPISTINAKNVHAIVFLKGEADKITASKDRVFKVHSKKSNKDYIVTASGMKVTCNCIGFEYRKVCKHSQAVAKKLGMLR